MRNQKGKIDLTAETMQVSAITGTVKVFLSHYTVLLLLHVVLHMPFNLCQFIIVGCRLAGLLCMRSQVQYPLLKDTLTRKVQ